MTRIAAQLVERLLGRHLDDGGPSSAELVRYLEGDEGVDRKACGGFLLAHPEVKAALVAGVAALVDDPLTVLEITPPAMVAAAADHSDPAPFPNDRRVLVEQSGYRLVYYCCGHLGQLLLTADEGVDPPAATVKVDGAPIAPLGDHADPSQQGQDAISQQGRATQRFVLGPVRELFGCQLEVVLLVCETETPQQRSFDWTVIPSGLE